MAGVLEKAAGMIRPAYHIGLRSGVSVVYPAQRRHTMSTVETRHKQHTIVDSPLGELTIVGEGEELTGLYFPVHQYVPDGLELGPRTDIGFEAVTGQLESYFAGRQANFYLELAPHGDDFQRTVWDLVKKVPYGSTTTYGAIAAKIGGHVTARDVGTAIARNPLCILIPCHRVFGSDGALTGYAGGLDRKRALLDLEQNSWVAHVRKVFACW
jgi:methylated-DNA-[protein]-cysteine S-methyltransferase